jgi:hypothetical protein
MVSSDTGTAKIAQIEPRGGAAVTLLEVGSNGKSASFLIGAGANRERQFGDFWRVVVTLKPNGAPMVLSDKITLSSVDEDFTPRNAMQAVTISQGL